MKKLTAFMLAALIIITPLYSYAVLPIIATAASAAGRVLVGNAVKKPVGTAVRRGALPCISSIGAAMSCVSVGLGIADLLRDKGYTVEEGDTINNNIEINIYKNEVCQMQIGFGVDENNVTQSVDADIRRRENIILSSKHDYVDIRLASDGDRHYRQLISELPKTGVPNDPQFPLADWLFRGSVAVYFEQQLHNDGNWRFFEQRATPRSNYYWRCKINSDGKTYISQSELNMIIDNSINNLSVDQRKQFYKNIYNYDFSQHPNITINNNSTSGDTINNDIKNAPKEFEVSVELGDKINNGLQDMDDINDQNCNKNDQGQYDKCGDDRNEPDPDPEPDPEPDPDPEPEPEPPPIECSANGLYQKICNWMDWTQQPHSPADDGKLDTSSPLR